MSTTAQKAIDKKAASLILQLEEKWTTYDLNRLVEYLKKCKSESPWGLAIKSVFSDDVPDASKVNSLLDGLSKQSVDDFITMAEIVGIRATLLLLRYYDKKNPNT